MELIVYKNIGEVNYNHNNIDYLRVFKRGYVLSNGTIYDTMVVSNSLYKVGYKIDFDSNIVNCNSLPFLPDPGSDDKEMAIEHIGVIVYR